MIGKYLWVAAFACSAISLVTGVVSVGWSLRVGMEVADIEWVVLVLGGVFMWLTLAMVIHTRRG